MVTRVITRKSSSGFLDESIENCDFTSKMFSSFRSRLKLIERTDQIALRNIIWHGSTCFLCILVIILPLEERQYQRNTPFIWTLRGTITVHIIRGHRFSLRFMISHSCAGSLNNRFTMCTFKRDNDLFSFFNFNFNLVKTLLSICKVTSNTEKCTYPYFLSNIFNYERNACSNISYCIYVL